MTTHRQRPVRFALIGAALARHVPDAELVVVADPFGDAAERLAGPLGADSTTDIDAALADERVEAVAITSTSTVHADLVQRAAASGKAVWCEKPMAMSLAEADSAVAACEQAGVPLQVGFNRRFSPDFAAAHEVVAAGGIGTPQLLRSLTRDPGLANPGYDVRSEIFGSAGMVTAGTPAHLSTTHWTTAGKAQPTSRQDTELMRDSYRAELEAFCRVVRDGEPSPVTGADARAALEVALTAVASVEQGAPVRLGAPEVAHA